MSRRNSGKKRNSKEKFDPKRTGNRYSRDASNEREDRPRNSDNDISWYSKYPNLLVAAGSFPYPNRPGMELQLGKALGQVGSTTFAEHQYTMFVPGVMALRWIPSFGYSQGPTDPASIMAKEMYARVRAAFSGTLAADAPDYVIYLGALDSVFSYLAWIKRIYRVLNAYTPDNYDLPDVVLTAMGLVPKTIGELRTNKTQFWQMINELVLYSRKFTCPAVMDLMNRHYWMNDNVYTDENSLNSQMYLFTQVGFYKFKMLNMPDGNPGPGLEMVENPLLGNLEAGTVLTTLFQFGRDLVDALVEWDDAYTISGYLKRAYEGVPSFMVDEIPSATIFTPSYNPEVLAQIENSRAVPLGSMAMNSTNIGKFNITQDVLTNSILSNPSMTVSADPTSPTLSNPYSTGFALFPPCLSARSDSPTVADSVIASRLQAGVTYKTGAAAKTVDIQITAGTEIPLEWNIYVDPAFSTYMTYPQLFQATQTTVFTQPGLLAAEGFDWHPLAFMLFSNTTNSSAGFRVSVIGDVHNITFITLDNLRNLHKICAYSEFNAFNQ